MRNLKSIVCAVTLVIAVSAPAFAKTGTISTTKAGTISTTKTGTISTTGNRAGTISTTRTGTISTTRVDTLADTGLERCLQRQSDAGNTNDRASLVHGIGQCRIELRPEFQY